MYGGCLKDVPQTLGINISLSGKPGNVTRAIFYKLMYIYRNCNVKVLWKYSC
jgi:hypothetical protein